MNPPYDFSDSVKGFELDDKTVLPIFDQSEISANMFGYKDNPVDLNFMEFPSSPPILDTSSTALASSGSAEVDSPDDGDFSDNVLKYINQILMEENMEEKPSMFDDPLALQAAEKSLYDALGEKYPPSPDLSPYYFDQFVSSRDDNFVGSCSERSTKSSSSSSSTLVHKWFANPGESSPFEQDSFNYSHSVLQTGSQSQSLLGSMKSNNGTSSGLVDLSGDSHLVSNFFRDSQSILQFKRGMEEAKRFLPSNGQLIINLDSYVLPSKPKETYPELVVKAVNHEAKSLHDGSKGRKNHQREDNHLEEERSSKQSAVYEEEEDELTEMFDRVLLLSTEEMHCVVGKKLCEETQTSQQNGKPQRPSGRKTRGKKQGNEKEVIDLTSLLINCAQSAAVGDDRTAYEQIKQIRQHSSASGDASQRLAHIFANGLEARLAGMGSQIYAALTSRKISAFEKLKAYQLYVSACPFMKMAIYFSNKMISNCAVKSGKKKLHVVDFGILYGFQWPVFIQFMSTLPGGPPELRITGIDFPRSVFRPAELVEETGRRLAKYCERFGVPFKYHAIAQKWDTLKLKDFKIDRDEVLAVNCIFSFKNLHDETIVKDSPRDVVLKLIRKMNPDIFTHSIVSGSYNSPFFTTRFREALFHFSSLFDMFEVNTPHDDQERKNVEQEFWGREVMNVIACEGLERVERPETYKNWHIRNIRSGFRILPLNEKLVKELRDKMMPQYHKDFALDEDGQWLLQGWKGRIICASSCWVPAW